MKITKSDWENWWSQPCAIELKKMMREDLEKLAHETMTPEHCRDGIQKAIEVGKYETTEFYLNLTYEDLEE